MLVERSRSLAALGMTLGSLRVLRGTALLVDEPLGDGHVVLFANEPMFRGWWRALDKLVLNAILLGPAF